MSVFRTRSEKGSVLVPVPSSDGESPMHARFGVLQQRRGVSANGGWRREEEQEVGHSLGAAVTMSGAAFGNTPRRVPRSAVPALTRGRYQFHTSQGANFYMYDVIAFCSVPSTF